MHPNLVLFHYLLSALSASLELVLITETKTTQFIHNRINKIVSRDGKFKYEC